MNARPSTKIARRVGRLALVGVWLGFLGFLALLAAELFLRMAPEPATNKPVYDRLAAAYAAFAVQHINPHYLFFFPIDDATREEINNETCSVGPEGFRGPGPESAGGRKLAFMIGGSAVFGHFASSNSTTITGYLNEIQDEYFFVNAGVPSWNTTQEMYRLVYQLLDYQPSLIVAYDAANDLSIALDYFDKGLSFPPGTPESFDVLESLIDDIRGVPRDASAGVPLYKRLLYRAFPNVAPRVRTWVLGPRDGAQAPRAPVPQELIRKTADKYVENIALMRDIAHARGARFVGVFQPVLWLHDNTGGELSGYEGADDAGHYRTFRRLILESRAELAPEYLDFSDVFDAHYDTISAFDRFGSSDVSEDAIFLDPVHLSDRGNEIVAREIRDYLAAETP